MKQRCHLPHKGRRDFFKKAIFLGAAALFAGAGGRRARAAVRRPATAPPVRNGYRLTRHIRRYYERAAF
jgi:hypothetical protein